VGIVRVGGHQFEIGGPARDGATTSVAVVVGAAGLAIAPALKGTLSKLAAGVMPLGFLA
jgi:small-conductance mechanosensitive channel